MRGLIAVVLLALAGCAANPPPPPQPVAATPLPTPQSKPPAPPKMVWVRIDGQRGPEVTQQTEVDLATCKALAETLAAQLQQGNTFNLNLRACMGQHGYKTPAP